MRQRTAKFIDPHEAAYLELLIGDSDPESRKIGLQRLCKLFRNGIRHRRTDKLNVFLMGLLHDPAPKVRRWALNALALAGDRTNVQAVIEAIQRHLDDADILGAGVSALCALLSDEEARIELQKIDLPIQGGVLLAAVQHSAHFKDELRITRVKIDVASDAELRLAGILVGLNKAPENLFSLSFPNSEVIGELNTHPDPVVAQYSVWATYENPTLGLKNLKLKLNDIESRPPNVRKYIYQLAAKNVRTAEDNYELLVMGSEDESSDARAGLATGLRDIYFDALEQVMIAWFRDEPNENVRQRLLEHMAANAEKCTSYRPIVLQAYEAADANSLTRSRLEASARNTSLLLDMKKITFDAEGRDLFNRSLSSLAASKQQPISVAVQRAKILIVTALAKEDAAMRAVLDRYEKFGHPSDSNIYHLGTIGAADNERSVILATSGMGNSNAAAVATNALRSFPQIEQIIMVGIAGGCPNQTRPDEHVRLGDIVYSNGAGIIEYDNVKETLDGRTTRSHPQQPSARLLQTAGHLASEDLLSRRPWEPILATASVKLGESFARPADETDVMKENGAIVPHPNDAARRPGWPRIHGGVIGAADTLLKNATTRNNLRDRFGIRAIEMESSGIQKAAWVQGKDVFVIRGICDYCDETKSDLWQNYAALAAAAYARAIIEAMPHEWF